MEQDATPAAPAEREERPPLPPGIARGVAAARSARLGAYALLLPARAAAARVLVVEANAPGLARALERAGLCAFQVVAAAGGPERAERGPRSIVGSLAALPLASGGLDAVVLGPGALDGGPIEPILGELRRVLSPGGVVALLAGRRRLRDLLGRDRGRRLDRVLRAHGFGGTRRFAILPGAEEPSLILSAGARAALGGSRASALRLRLARGPLARYVAATTIIAGGCRPTRLAALAAAALREAGLVAPAQAADLAPVRVTSNGVAILALDLEGPDGAPVPAIFKVPLDAAAAGRLARAAAVLADLHADARLGADRDLVPRVLFVAEGGAAVLERRLLGRMLRHHLVAHRYAPDATARALGDAMAFLGRLHGATARRAEVDTATFDRLVAADLGAIGARIRPEDREALRRLEARTRAALVGRTLPLVRSHGDFHLMNLLADREGRLTGVLDWEFSAADDLPVVDALHLLLGPTRRLARLGIGEAIVARLVPMRLGAIEERLLADYLATIGLGRDLMLALRTAYWARQAAPHAAQGRTDDPAWYEEMIARPLAAFEGERDRR